MKNKMEDLRNHLFAALEGLADPEKPMEIARAQAISDVAQVLINSAKVEVELIKTVGSKATSKFLESTPTLEPIAGQVSRIGNHRQ